MSSGSSEETETALMMIFLRQRLRKQTFFATYSFEILAPDFFMKSSTLVIDLSTSVVFIFGAVIALREPCAKHFTRMFSSIVASSHASLP